MKKYLVVLLALLMVFTIQIRAYAADGDEISTTSFRIDGNGEMYYQVLNEILITDDTVTASESGKVFLMHGSTDVTMTLPAADEGLHYTFVNANATSFTVNPNGSETLNYKTLAAGDAMRSGETVGDCVTVYASDDSVWFVNANEDFTDVD